MPRKLFICVAAACAAFAAVLPVSPAVAGATAIYETQGRALFRFEVPDGWQMLAGFDVPAAAMPAGDGSPMPRIMSVLPPEEATIMWTGLWAPTKVRRLEAAPDYVRELAPYLLNDGEITYSDTREVNGLAARVISGIGTRDGRDVDFAMAGIQVADDRVAFIAFIGEPGTFDRYQEALVGVLNSIVPADEPAAAPAAGGGR